MPTALEQTYLEIGRLYVQSIEFSERVQEYLEILEFAEFSDVVDFAAASGKARKKPNCNSAKSQLCGMACVPLSKQCAKNATATEKTAGDFVAKATKAKKEKPVKEVEPKTPKTPKAATKAKKTEEVVEPVAPAPVAAKAVQAKPKAEDVAPPPKAETPAPKKEEAPAPVKPKAEEVAPKTPDPVKAKTEEMATNLFGKKAKATKANKEKAVKEVAPKTPKAPKVTNGKVRVIPTETIPIRTPPESALAVLSKHKDKIDSDLLPFLEMAQGRDLKISDIDAGKAVDFLEAKTNKPYKDTDKHKVVSSVKGMSSDEALALSHWLGVSYPGMSKRIWNSKNEKNNPNAKEYLDASILAAQALRKLPPATEDQISKEAKDNGEDYTPGQAMNRWMRMDADQLDGFISKYEQNIGKTIVEDNFFGVSHLSAERMSAFSDGANITYSVKSKTDGTGQGRYVEWVKTKAMEGEILYPPMSRFKVTNVTKKAAPEIAISKEIEDAKKFADEMDVLQFQVPLNEFPNHYKEKTGKDFPGWEAYAAAQELLELSPKASGPSVVIELEEAD